ncbi:MAG: hypothetical protein WBA74_16145 [Cyclobacteriaceae bacterium]
MITISSNSIDELNLIYKKVKKDFTATDAIKLNQETLEYEMVLERPELNNSMIAVADKVLEIDELMDEDPSIFDNFTWMRFKTEVEKDKLSYVSLQPLKAIWRQLKASTKQAVYIYLCQQKEIEPSLGTKLVA